MPLLSSFGQDRQCYIVAGKSIVGWAAVWRSPKVLPTDIELWEAVPWPSDLWAVPNNCVVCSTIGHGATNLAGGDYDGDTLCVCLNRHVLNFLDMTEVAVRGVPLEAVDTVRDRLAKRTPTSWRSKNRESQFLAHVLSVPTPNVRGSATVHAEISQDGCFQSFQENRSCFYFHHVCT